MERARVWLPPVLIITAIVLQSTLLQRLSIAGVVPDISLMLLIFFANRQGCMQGQISGFASGLVQDFLSTAPLGFYAFIRTITGFLYGLTKGKFFVDPILLPIILVVVGTLFKALLTGILGLFFIPPESIEPVFGQKLWIELGFNALISPFLFGLLKVFKVFKVRNTGGFS